MALCLVPLNQPPHLSQSVGPGWAHISAASSRLRAAKSPSDRIFPGHSACSYCPYLSTNGKNGGASLAPRPASTIDSPFTFDPLGELPNQATTSVTAVVSSVLSSTFRLLVYMKNGLNSV